MSTSFKDSNDVNQEALIDDISGALIAINNAHKEIHEGEDFFVIHSIPSLGAQTTPDDMVTLTFTTPDTSKWGHFEFRVIGTGGWRVRLIEAPSGGMATPTGSLNILNSNRNSSNVSTFKDVAGSPASGKVSYDATLATGGITVWDEYLAGSSGPQSGGEIAGHDQEIILKQNTTYQLSVYGTDTDPISIRISWYEHANIL